jgi:glycosyltransferase involved in cell wall biosynthesis
VRIGIDGTPVLGNRTGVGWYTAELIRSISDLRLGHEIVLLEISWRRPGSQADVIRPGVSVAPARVPARAMWALWDRLTRPSLEAFVRTDVYHATNYLAPPARRTPVVVTVHDLGFVRFPQYCLPFERRYAQRLPRVLERASCVIVLTEFIRRELIEWIPSVSDRTFVVPQGPHRRHRPGAGTGLPDGAPFVLCMGSLDPRKNIAQLLDAFRILRSRGVDLRLVLAGQPSPLLDVGAMIAERGLGRDVVVTGYVPDERAASLYAQARLLAFPSLYEGFGMPLVEAMGAGLPIVACRAGPTPELVGDAALLHDPGDAEAMADAIRLAATDDAVRATMIDAGRERAAAFDWSAAARATLDVYAKAIA